MNEAMKPERLREQTQDLILKTWIVASLSAAGVGFVWMWAYWISHMKVIGLVIGWFFGLQTAVMFFVAGAFGFGLVAMILLCLFEIGLVLLDKYQRRTPKT